MSKKVKGQKLDLASFVGPNNPTMNLPTAPDPSRQKKEGRRREDGSFEIGDRVDNKFDRERSSGNRDGVNTWTRNGREEEQVPNASSNRFHDLSDNQGEQNWRKVAPSTNVSKLRTSGGSDGRYSDSFAEERPGHMKLKLLPRSEVPLESVESSGGGADDKWSKVFKNSSSERSHENQGRFGKGSGFQNGRREEPIDDPRFVGKFGNNPSNNLNRRNNRDEIHSLSLPSAPRGVLSAHPPVVVVNTQAISVDNKAVEEAKLAKAAARLELERKTKEAKECAAAQAVADALKSQEERSLASVAASDLLSSGLKGIELLEFCKSSNLKTTGSMVLKRIFLIEEELVSFSWWSKSEYGALLQYLLAGSSSQQVDALFVVQEICYEKKFPKVEVKGVFKKLIEVLFGILLSNDLVELDSFLAWADDLGGESLGRLDSIIQTTNFIQTVRHAMSNNFEEDDDDEVDAPRQTVK